MKNLDDLPKSITKAIRYIKQDATQEQLFEIKELVDRAVTLRIKKNLIRPYMNNQLWRAIP